ncbi:hypothetical protein EGI22_22815 [Lacihabitans sp. LS3-19]|nr:hypothetical protein [Lacihabitans sp. LS3-19]
MVLCIQKFVYCHILVEITKKRKKKRVPIGPKDRVIKQINLSLARGKNLKRQHVEKAFEYRNAKFQFWHCDKGFRGQFKFSNIRFHPEDFFS